MPGEGRRRVRRRQEERTPLREGRLVGPRGGGWLRQRLGGRGEPQGRRGGTRCGVEIARRGVVERRDAGRDGHFHHVAAEEAKRGGAAAGDDARVMHGESPAHKKQRGRRRGIDAGRAEPPHELGGEVADAGGEELEAARGVLVRHVRHERLERQAAFELVHLPEEERRLFVAAVAGAAHDLLLGVPHRLHRTRVLEHLPQRRVGGPRMGQGEESRGRVEPDVGHEGRHHDDRRALAHARLEPPLRPFAVARRTAAQRLAERGEGAARRRRLHPRVEPPAERVGAVGEADGGLVQGHRRHVDLEPPGEPGEGLGVEPTAGGRDREGDLHLPAAGERVVHVLLLAHRIEREDAEGPPPPHVLVEGGAGLG